MSTAAPARHRFPVPAIFVIGINLMFALLNVVDGDWSDAVDKAVIALLFWAWMKDRLQLDWMNGVIRHYGRQS